LSGAPIVGDPATYLDRVAVHGTGEECPELSADGRERGLVDHRHAVDDVTLLDEGHALVHQTGRLEVTIPQPLRDVHGPPGKLDGLLDLSGVHRLDRLATVEIAALDPFGFRLEQSLRAVEPSCRHRTRELGPVFT